MKKSYRIREGSIAHYVIGFLPFMVFILVASICTAITGTV